MPTVQARVEQSLKEDAETVFQNLGLDSATAIRVFLKKVVATKSIPFALEEEPYFSPEEEEEILAAAKGEGSEVVARTSTRAETRAFLDSLK